MHDSCGVLKHFSRLLQRAHTPRCRVKPDKAALPGSCHKPQPCRAAYPHVTNPYRRWHNVNAQPQGGEARFSRHTINAHQPHRGCGLSICADPNHWPIKCKSLSRQQCNACTHHLNFECKNWRDNAQMQSIQPAHRSLMNEINHERHAIPKRSYQRPKWTNHVYNLDSLCTAPAPMINLL